MARTTSDSTLTVNPACSPNAERRSLRDMFWVDREARAVLDLNILARKENTVLTFQAVFVVAAPSRRSLPAPKARSG